jgi:hypothetical protein
MDSIWLTPAKTEAVMSSMVLPSPAAREDRNSVGVLMPPSGFPDVVSDDRRHLSEGGQRLTFDEPLLGGDELGQIAEKTDGPERPAIALEDTRQGQCAGKRAPSRVATVTLRRQGPSSAHCLLELWSDAPAIVLVQDVEGNSVFGRKARSPTAAARPGSRSRSGHRGRW